MKVLVVNGEVIEEAAIQKEAAAILQLLKEKMEGEDPQVLRERAREWAEENQIEAALLRQTAMAEADAVPLDCSPDAVPAVKIERLVTRVTSEVPPPRRKDVVAYYLKNRESFLEAERVRAAHIVKNVDEQHGEESARAGIERASEELAKGRKFEEVADEMSDCPGKGGDLGRFSRGQMVDAFDDVVFAMKVDEVSGIFRTEFGFHIAKLLERIPAGARPLEEVYDDVERLLHEEKKQKKLHQYLDHLRAHADVRKEERAS